jgi:hypothetical protein
MAQAEASGEKTAFDKVLQAEQLVRVRSLTDSLESVLWGLRATTEPALSVEHGISVAALPRGLENTYVSLSMSLERTSCRLTSHFQRSW